MLMRDVAYAVRTLRQSAGFTVVAGFTLVLGIGATTAIFSVVNAVLLRSLPYREPSRLVHVLGDDAADPRSGVPWRAFELWKSENGPFSDLAAYYRNTGWSRLPIGGTDEPETDQAAFTTANFFSTMGVSPFLGRVFNEFEERTREPVTVLSYSLWQRRFHADPAAIGRMIDIDDRGFTVIGVMPREFHFPARETQAWLPISTNRYWDDRPVPDDTHGRGYYMRWNVVGRLQPGATVASASQYLNGVTDWRPTVIPLSVELNGNARLGLFVLFGSACLVLLIGCANVASLLLARGTARARQMSVRVALGATQGRIIQQILTESLVLVSASACGAVLLAVVVIRILVRYSPADLPRLEETSIDWRVLLFTLSASVVAAVSFGIAPALKAGRSDPNEFLKAGGRTHTDGKARAGGMLVACEFALALVLLVTCGLLIRSLSAVESVPLGFSVDHVLTLQVRLPAGATPLQNSAFEEEVLARIQSLPGVERAGGIGSLFELSRPPDNSLRAVEGRPPLGDDRGALTWTTVSGEYFQAMGIAQLAGRYFSDRDNASSPLVAIIDEALARRYWPNENPVGKRFKGQDKRGANDEWLTVIGVVRNARRQGVEHDPTPHVYEWHRQSGPVTGFVVRTKSEPAALGSALRMTIREIEPHAIVSSILPMRGQIELQTAVRRFQTWLVSLFAALAMILSTVGTYGVMSYATARRTHEIGVRIAVGAQRSNILGMVLRSGMTLAIWGLCAGFAASFAVTKILSGLLYGITARDPLTFVAVGVLLIGVGAAATVLPAWRATRVDPLVTLRSM
jgi:putative ABC transport system permease protein